MVQLDNFRFIACIRFVRWNCVDVVAAAAFLSQSSRLYLCCIRDAFHYQHHHTSGCHRWRNFHVMILKLFHFWPPADHIRRGSLNWQKKNTFNIFIFLLKIQNSSWKLTETRFGQYFSALFFSIKHWFVFITRTQWVSTMCYNINLPVSTAPKSWMLLLFTSFLSFFRYFLHFKWKNS